MTRLVNALKEVGQTFELFQRGEIGPCESTPSPVQVPNLVPSSYCRVQGVAPPPGDEIIEDKCKGVPPATPRELTYTQKDVIDDHISIPAQHSLVRLSKNPDTSADAVGMLEAVKSRQLEGIYCVNWKKSAQRARKFNSDWWTVIPEGEDAVLMLDPENLQYGPPMIAFRRKLHPDCGLFDDEESFPPENARLDAALLRTWQTYKRFRKCELVPCSLTDISTGEPSGEPTAPETCRAQIRRDLLVVVTEEGTQPPRPVPRAAVRVVGPSPSGEFTTRFTDETGPTRGQARFSDIASGSYQVTASKEGFEEASKHVLVTDDEEQASSFAGGEGVVASGGVTGVALQLRTKQTLRVIDVEFVTGDTQKIKAPIPGDPNRTVTQLVLPVGKTALLRATGAPPGHVYAWTTVKRIKIVKLDDEKKHPNECVIEGLEPGSAGINVSYYEAGTIPHAFTPIAIMVVSVEFIGSAEKPPVFNRLDKLPASDRVAHQEFEVKFAPVSFWKNRVAEWDVGTLGASSNVGTLPPQHDKQLEQVGSFSFSRSASGVTSTINTSGVVKVRVNLPPVGFNHGELGVMAKDFPTVTTKVQYIVPAVVVIDPGHGGTQAQTKTNSTHPGCASSNNNATSTSNVLEKTMTLDMGRRIEQALENLANNENPIIIILTRNVDAHTDADIVNPSGCARANTARDNGADVFLSIHFDGNDDPAVRGPRTYIHSTNNINDAEDQAFAQRIQRAVTTRIPEPVCNTTAPNFNPANCGINDTVRKLGVAVLNDNNLGRPPNHPVRACLVELEFITNNSADALFNPMPDRAQFRGELAEDIARAILLDLGQFNNEP